ncbi:hypothetical protein [Deinococcus sp.]|uniref:hypothetical protein n=1 Tax=Deinococcus sp. TaxID=47478 RepID=UPI003CC6B305
MPQPDPWKSAPVPAQRPQVDAWGRALLSYDPATERAALSAATARLGVWLGVLVWALALLGLLSALGLPLGGLAALSWAARLDPALNISPAGPLLWLAGLLLAALYVLYIMVLRWARELIVRLGAWAAASTAGSPAPDAARIEQLRRTLAGWLTFGQWGALASALLGVALVPLGAVWGQRLAQTLGQLVPGSAAQAQLDFTSSPGYIAFQTVSALVSSAPGVVIAWLILGAIRRLMNQAVNRARGLVTPPLTPAANTVGGWFLGVLILLGLSILQTLVVGVLALVFGAVFRSQFALGLPEPWASLLPGLLGGVAGLLLLSVLASALLFYLILASRRYAASLGRVLDAAALPT